MYSVTREFSFEAAHRLTNYTGSCSNIHGHSYKVQVTISSNDNLNDQGFVVDFSNLKLFKNWLDDHMDHALILASHDEELIGIFKALKYDFKMFIMPPNYENPSAECMCHFFTQVIYQMFTVNMPLPNMTAIAVKVWETEKSFAEYTAILGGDSDE